MPRTITYQDPVDLKIKEATVDDNTSEEDISSLLKELTKKPETKLDITKDIIGKTLSLGITEPLGMAAGSLAALYNTAANPVKKALGVGTQYDPAATFEAVTQHPLFRYEPTTETGKEFADVVETPFRWLTEATEAAGKKTQEVTDSPAAGALAELGTLIGTMGAIGKGIQVGGKKVVSKYEKHIKELEKKKIDKLLVEPEQKILEGEKDQLASMIRQSEKKQKKAEDKRNRPLEFPQGKREYGAPTVKHPSDLWQLEPMTPMPERGALTGQGIDFTGELPVSRNIERTTEIGPETTLSPFGPNIPGRMFGGLEADALTRPVKTFEDIERQKTLSDETQKRISDIDAAFEQRAAQLDKQKNAEMELIVSESRKQDLAANYEKQLADLNDQRWIEKEKLFRQRLYEERAQNIPERLLEETTPLDIQQRQKYMKPDYTPRWISDVLKEQEGMLSADKQQLRDQIRTITQEIKVEDLIKNRTITGAFDKPLGAKIKGQRGSMNPEVFKEGLAKLAKTLSESEFVRVITEKYGPEFAKGAVALYRQAQETNLDDLKITPFRERSFKKTTERAALELEHGITSGADPVKMLQDIETEFRKLGHEGTRSWKETERLATKMGKSPKEVLKLTEEDMRSDVQVAYVENTMKSTQDIIYNKLDTLLKQAAESGSFETVNPADWVDLIKAVEIHGGLARVAEGKAAEAGRTLKFIQKMQHEKMGNQAKFITDLFESLGGRVKMERMLEIIHNTKFMTDAERARVLRQVSKPTNLELFREFYINTKLTAKSLGPNLIGDAMVVPMAIGERIISAALGTAWQHASKLSMGLIKEPASRVHWQEVGAMYHALHRGTLEGLETASRAWKTETPLDPMTKLETSIVPAIDATRLQLDPNSLIGQGVNLAGTIVRLPGRTMITMDEFFKSLAFRMEANAQLYRKGIAEEKLTGKKLDEYVKKNMDELPKDIAEIAADFSNYQTFNKKLGTAGESLRRFFSGHYAGVYIAPFFRTPVNLVKYAGERSWVGPVPLGIFSRNMHKELAAGGARSQIAMGKMLMGLGISQLIGLMYAEGLITGGGPIDKVERSNWRAENEPYSWKFTKDGPSRTYGRADPIAIPISLTTDYLDVINQAVKSGASWEQLDEFLKSEEAEKAALGIVAMFANAVVNKTWMQGVANAFELLRTPDVGVEQAWYHMATGWIPTVANQWRRELDPVFRQVNSTNEAFKNKFATWSKDLVPLRDQWGEIVTIEKEFPGDQLIKPYDIKTPKNDPVRKEVIRLGIPLKRPQKQIRIDDHTVLELEPKEWDWLQEKAGPEAHEWATRFVTSPQWDNFQDWQKKDVIKDIVNTTRARYKTLLLGEILRNNPDRIKEAREKAYTPIQNSGWE